MGSAPAKRIARNSFFPCPCSSNRLCCVGKGVTLLGPSEAIVGMTELLGTTVLSGKHAARILREAHRDYWPEIGSGRRGSTYLRHLFNYWMMDALCASQPKNGPQALELLGKLKLLSTENRVPVGLPPNPNKLLSPSEFKITTQGYFKLWDTNPLFFVPHMLGIVREAVRLLRSGNKVPFLGWPEVRITVGSASVPMSAIVRWTDFENEPHRVEEDLFVSGEYLSHRTNLPSETSNKLYRTQVIIGRDELIAFAQLASKAEDDDLNTSSEVPPGSGAEGNATPETTKPAGTGIHDGLQDEPPATKQTADPHKSQSAIGKARKQSLPKPVVFRLQAHSPPATERTRHHGAHWTDAASP